MSAIEEFRAMMAANKTGTSRGLYSVCSAHKGVIRASMAQAKADGSILLVESTSNQVDQNGGYTGMTPADFVAYLQGIAEEMDFPSDRLLMGGDHLGPNAWQSLPEVEAMAQAHVLVEQYVRAGYQKIHLDASMFLADDQGDRHQPLADEIVASRAAALCRSCEEAWKTLPEGSPAPVYVIGTEVPIPGGATEEEDDVPPTPAADARRTVEVTKKAFLDAGLEDAWERVCALVVQPGVEFGDDQVFDYDGEAAADLRCALDDVPHLVYEAHSTDYQTLQGLSAMVDHHFCIQKVGPWLTFAYREGLFALAAIEDELFAGRPDSRSGIREKVEEVMLAEPKYWKKYYPGSEDEQRIKRHFSYSDRVRYYWPHPILAQAVETLFANLRSVAIPMTLLCQYLPAQYQAVRAGELEADPQALAEHKVREVLAVYSAAGRMKKD